MMTPEQALQWARKNCTPDATARLRSRAAVAALADEARANKADAERYRWLRNNPQWVGYDADYRPDQIDMAIAANGCVDRNVGRKTEE